MCRMAVRQRPHPELLEKESHIALEPCLCHIERDLLVWSILHIYDPLLSVILIILADRLEHCHTRNKRSERELGEESSGQAVLKSCPRAVLQI